MIRFSSFRSRKKLIRDNKLLNDKLTIQIEIDAYKDDLITTLRNILVYKDERLTLQYLKADKLLKDANESLVDRINIQTATDGYKDDMNNTLKSLLEYKEDIIEMQADKLNKHKRNE